MRAGSIVFHERHGLMVILKEEAVNNIPAFRVANSATGDKGMVVLANALRQVSDETLKRAAAVFDSAYYARNERNEAIQCYEAGKVGPLSMPDEKTVSAVVEDGKFYRATIRCNYPRPGRTTVDCLCTGTACCKHIYALSYAIKQQHDALKKLYSVSNGIGAKMEGLPLDEQFSRIMAEPIGKDKVVYGLGNLVLTDEAYALQTAQMLDTFVHKARLTNEQEKAIVRAAASLPQGMFLSGYLKECFEYSSYGWFSRIPTTYRECSAELDEAALFRYFGRAYSVDREELCIYVRYRLISPVGENAMVVSKRQPVVYSAPGIDENDIDGMVEYYGLLAKGSGYSSYAVENLLGGAEETKLTRNLFPERLGNAIACVLMRKIDEEHGEEIRAEVERLRRETEEELEQSRRKRLQKSLEKFCASIDTKRVRLNSRDAAELAFSFIGYDEGESLIDAEKQHLCVELKIGLVRKYVVRNILNFADMFREEKTFQYGKELTFTHCVENVKESQQAALQVILIAANATDTYHLLDGNKGLPLDANTLTALFNALRGTVVDFYGKPCTVTLEPVRCRVAMDRDFRLSVKLPAENYVLLSSGNNLYVVNRDASEIQRAEVSSDEKKLILFAMENGKTSFEAIAEQFSNEIYSRFASVIDVDGAISDRIKISDIAINAYFDYVNGTITVREEYTKDGKVIKSQRSLCTYDKNAIANYEDCLAGIGFVDKVLSDEAGVLNFFAMDMTTLKSYCNVYLSESIRNKELQSFRPQVVRIQYSNNIMEAFLEKSDYDDAELKEILKAVRHKKKYVLLSGDRIVDLRGEDAAELEATVTDLGLKEDAPTRPVQLPIAKALRAFAHEKGCRIDDMLKNMIRDIRDFKSSDIPVPKVQATLRPYQTDGFRWMKILSDYGVGGILADDMGLGKTLQVITLLKADDTPAPSLVVCPTSLVFNWVNEFRRFDPDAAVTEVYGPAAQRHKIIKGLDRGKKICLITSYDALRSDIDLYDFPVHYMVLDEAQYIKNVNAQKSRSVKTLKAAHKFALTGTPIENNVIDLWSIFDFIMPGYLDDLTAFKRAYNANEAYTKQIARRIGPFLLRRTKKDVLTDLPEKYERVLTAEMTADQRKVYDAYRLEAREAMENGSNAFDILPYLMRLREICDDPALIAENYTGGSGKMDALSGILDDALAAGHRILLFSQFVKALERIEQLLGEKKLPYYKITGNTPSEERIRLMDAFNAGHSVNVFLVSLKAGGTGLNLTGADTVIHFDPWWNVAAEDQASDRAHRIGQTRNVEVIKLISESSVEQRVIELQNIKKDLIDKLISDSDKSVTSASLEDIRFILK